MLIVILFSLIALILTYLEATGKLKNGMKFGFALITFLGAIHYDYGNDYMSYMYIYKECTSVPFDLSSILAKVIFKESGWVLLCWAFKNLGGFFVMVAVLNIVQNIIVYKFIKFNVSTSWWPLAIFIYLFSTSFYLMSFSMMRQEFVMIIFLGLWQYIKGRNWVIPLLVLYACSFIHSSALILLPFSFWGFIPMKNGKCIGCLYIFILIFLWSFKGILNNLFQYALTLDEVFYNYAESYDSDDNSMHIGLGFIMNLIPFVLSTLFLCQNNLRHSSEQKLLVAIASLSFLITPFSRIIPIVGRLGMFFSIFNLGAIPLIYGNIRKPILRIGFLSLFSLMTIYNYIIFFNSPIWQEKYTIFHTIFSQIF